MIPKFFKFRLNFSRWCSGASDSPFFLSLNFFVVVSAVKDSQVTGKVDASDYASPTPVGLTTAVSDMETAYTDANGRPNTDLEKIGFKTGLIGGENLTPGAYTFDTDISIAWT